MAKVAILGLGLIGGSLGLAWRKAGLGLEIVGHDAQPEVAHAARKRGAIDRAEWNIPAAVANAKLVVLATPVSAMESLMRTIADCLPEGCLVTDTGSTKRQVMEWAQEILPAHVSFVGGHPMAGKETSGIDAADPTIFTGRPYCLVPSMTATEQSVETMVTLAQALDAEPFFISAEEHDGLVAAVSHLPFLAATALMRVAALSPGWKEMSLLAASGFRDTTRLASGDPEMHAAICDTNRDNVIRWIDALVAELTRLRQAVESDATGLKKALTDAQAARDRWLAGATDKGRQSQVEVPSLKDQMGQTLFGTRLMKAGDMLKGPVKK